MTKLSKRKSYVICQQMLPEIFTKNFQEVEAVIVAGVGWGDGKSMNTNARYTQGQGGGLCNINPNQVMATEYNQINEKNSRLNYKSPFPL